MDNPYETDRLLAEYLLFHYGAPEEVLPYAFGPREALDFAVRTPQAVALAGKAEDGKKRALDLGCAVGRSTFELARFYGEVLGVDYSQRFVQAARRLARGESICYERLEEGEITTALVARAPSGIDLSRVRFEQGDAGALPEDEDEAEPAAVQREDGSWLIDGRTDINQVERIIERRGMQADGEYHTLAGFVLWELGHVPRIGEHLDWQGLRFEVIDMDGRRIDRVLVNPTPAAGTAAPPAD